MKLRPGQAAGIKKVHKVALSDEEEVNLQALISKGKTSARKLTRARILLFAYAGGKDQGDCSRPANQLWQPWNAHLQNWVLEGLQAALEEAPWPGAKSKLDAQGYGFLVALACNAPPQSRED